MHLVWEEGALSTRQRRLICTEFHLSFAHSVILLSSRFSVYKEADLMDFINAPVGKGLPITKTLLPLIAIPTTAGTGSETTGTAILDITSRSFKTGIANRALKPVLGIVVR
jgi:alcohol dehydrogenase class IV